MPSIRISGKHGFNVQFSPFFPKYIACAASENYGLKGTGSLLILENDNSENLKLRKCCQWMSGLLDLRWLKNNENLIVTCSCDGSIHIWKLLGGDAANPIRVFKEHILDVSSIDSKDNLIASGSWDSTIKIWDINNISSALTLEAGPGIIHSVKWSNAFPNLILSVSNSYNLALWDRSSPKSSVHQVKPQNSEALDCDWSRNNPYELAVGGSDGVIRIWDIRSFQSPRHVISGPHKPLARIRWSPHHPHIIATTSYNLSTAIWNASQGLLLETIRHHSAFILGLDFNSHVPGEIADCGLDSLVHVFTPWSLLELNYRKFLKNKL